MRICTHFFLNHFFTLAPIDLHEFFKSFFHFGGNRFARIFSKSVYFTLAPHTDAPRNKPINSAKLQTQFVHGKNKEVMITQCSFHYMSDKTVVICLDCDLYEFG